MRWIFVFMLIAIAPALADSNYPGPYQADVFGAYDGDTISAHVSIWPDLTATPSIRVRGVDTPEIRGDCEEEERLAQEARDFTLEHVQGENVTLRDVELGKYAGRVVATVLVGGRDLADMLIEEGLGRAYDGGGRDGWCPTGKVPIRIPPHRPAILD